MDQLIKTIFDWMAGQGVGVAMLMFAIIWLYRKSRADALAAATAVKEAWLNADRERSQRFDFMAQSIEQVRSGLVECEKDRRQLWQNLFQLGLKSPSPDTDQGKPDNPSAHA